MTHSCVSCNCFAVHMSKLKSTFSIHIFLREEIYQLGRIFDHGYSNLNHLPSQNLLHFAFCDLLSCSFRSWCLPKLVIPVTLFRFKTWKVEHWIARCSICFMFLGKEFCLQISKRGLGPCPKHMSFLAAFPKMLFELEHHQEEERRFVRLLMQFFCLVRLGAICNLLQTTVESVGWGQRHSHPPCECTWVLSILDEYVLCKSIPYEFIWFFHVRIQK